MRFIYDGKLRIEPTPNSSIRVVQVKEIRMNILYKTVIYGHKGRPWGKLLDDPQHLENSIEIYLQEPVKLNHVIISKAWVKSLFIIITSYLVLNFQQRLF